MNHADGLTATCSLFYVDERMYRNNHLGSSREICSRGRELKSSFSSSCISNQTVFFHWKLTKHRLCLHLHPPRWVDDLSSASELWVLVWRTFCSEVQDRRSSAVLRPVGSSLLEEFGLQSSDAELCFGRRL